MLKFLTGLMFVAAAFSAAFFAGKKEGERTVPKEEAKSSYVASPYPLKTHSFVVVISGYNNGAYIEKTLRSVFSQVYDSYRLVYIDDASDDGSFALARDLIYELGDLTKVTFVRNEQRLGELANLYRAVQGSKEDEIIVPIHADDWLAHEWVLTRLNQYYANPDLWLTYGQYREFPSYGGGSVKAISIESLRNQPLPDAQLNTFYAALFNKISEGDFVHQGVFFPERGTLAYFFPLLEMAQSHASFIDEIHYIANRAALKKEDRDTAQYCEKTIRGLTSYAPLTNLFSVQGEL